MIVPLLSHHDLLADIHAAREDTAHVHIWWLGQSGFLVQWQGRHLLLDPYLSNSLTAKYAETDKPHVRMTEIPVLPGRLDFLDVVTSSHNHTDHLDAETLVPLLKVNSDLTVVVPAANRHFAADRLGVPPERLTIVEDGESISAAGFTIHGVPAAHEAIERDEAGRCLFLGYVVEFGPYVIYHSGDCIPYEGQVERLCGWKIDLALLPINGRLPQRRVAGNFWGREAAELAKAIGAGLAIPCHYDMFTFNTATPDEFVAACEFIEQPYRVLRCGERLSR